MVIMYIMCHSPTYVIALWDVCMCMWTCILFTVWYTVYGHLKGKARRNYVIEWHTEELCLLATVVGF